MSNEAPERLEDELFRMFETLRERGMRRAAVGFVMDLLNYAVVHDESKPSGVLPKAVESREISVAAHRRAVRSIISFLALRADERPQISLDATVRTRVGAQQIAAEAVEAAELLDEISRQCALYVEDCVANGLPRAQVPVLLHILSNAVGNDNVLKRYIDG